MTPARPLRIAGAALAALCLGLTLLASALWYLQLKGDLALLFHSDTDFLPALYRDLVEQGGKLSHWNLTPAPSFFPDWPLFFLANYVGGDFFHALPLFFVLQGLLLFLLSLALLRRGMATHQAMVAAGWACVLLFSWAMDGMVPYNYFYLSGFHCGVFLLLLLSLRLLDQDHGHDRARRVHWPLALVALLATVSDRLYLLQFALPALATLWLLDRRGGRPWKAACAAIVLGALAGILLYKVKWLVAHPLRLPWGVSPAALAQNLPALAQMLGESWRESRAGTLGLAAYYTALTLLLPGTLLGRGWRIADPAAARLALFSWLSAAACLAATLVSTNLFTVRYFIPAYVLPLLAGPALLYLLLPERRRVWLTLALLAATVWPTQAMLRPALRDVALVQPAYYPPEVACMDQVIAHYGLRHGVASYWDAKRVGMLSRHRPQIAPYDQQLRAFHWITSEKVFRANYDFALVRHAEGLDLDTLIRLNGTPAARVDCGIFEVAVFPGGGLRRGFMP
ncbi:hypothetical protein [Duganella aceris]|uniref:Glycosyltransferase RgtA/B/C/D-like domain-containing protein n=1 Tax=Duganella aceris TaxID=2703883 RepID=A0ABX0FPI3_9BURK|nr:hypothetical protein [Duganella aceris]NGZ86546.1 hypothetical protein [Duganella aceris]